MSDQETSDKQNNNDEISAMYIALIYWISFLIERHIYLGGTSIKKNIEQTHITYSNIKRIIR